MSALLDTVRMEIRDRELRVEQLGDEIARLQEIERLAEGLPGMLAEEPEVEPRERSAPGFSEGAATRGAGVLERRRAAAKKAGAASKAARPDLGPSQRKVLEYLRQAGRPVAPAEVADELGMSRAAAKAACGPLVKAGKVVAEGNTIHRTWRVAEVAIATGAAPATDGRKIAALQRRVMELLVKEEPLTEAEIAEQLGQPRDDVAEACGKLLTAGKLELLEDGGYGVVA